MYSPAANKSQYEPYKTPTPTTKKIMNEVNSAQTKSSVNAQRDNEKDDKILNSEINKAVNNKNNNESKKYVYQPPKKYIPGLKMVTSITKENEKEPV